MYKKDVIDHFGTQRAVAKALGISDAAVSQWKEVIPEKDAYRLEVVTAGALKYQESAYRKAAQATCSLTVMVLIPAEMREYNAHKLMRITSYLLRKYLHMVRANKRNEALRIESALLNKIAMLGTEKTAEAVGVDKSQISRWKRDWIPKFSMLLAVLEWGVVDDDMARLARQVASILTNKKRPVCKTERSEQIQMEF